MLQLVEDGGVYTLTLSELHLRCRFYVPAPLHFLHILLQPFGVPPLCCRKRSPQTGTAGVTHQPRLLGFAVDGQTGVEGRGDMRQAWKDGEDGPWGREEAQGGSHTGASGEVGEGRWRVE